MDLSNRGTQAVLMRAVEAGMEVVRVSQGGHLRDDPEVKDDKTLVTITDHRSESAITNLIRQSLGDVRIIGEEGEDSGSGDLAMLIDPLDGTRAFSSGLTTSTVILAVYDTTKKKVMACVVGEAVSGRIWSAFGDSPTQLDMSGVSVWKQRMNEQSTVFLDVSHGFTRKGRQILTDKQMSKLFGLLNGRVKLSIPGSNGLIQALVANGGQKVAGSITTAIGGPWDVCGVKLVLNAGGSAKAFSVIRNGEDCWIEERDPLDVMSYDILICGNSDETVGLLYQALVESLL